MIFKSKKFGSYWLPASARETAGCVHTIVVTTAIIDITLIQICK